MELQFSAFRNIKKNEKKKQKNKKIKTKTKKRITKKDRCGY